MLRKVKGVVVGVAVSSIGAVAMAQDANGVKAAMDAIKADATENLGIMVPAGLIIMGLIVGAGITLGIMRKVGNKIG